MSSERLCLIAITVTSFIQSYPGWQSTPGGIKPTYLKDHGHTVFNPKLPDGGGGDRDRPRVEWWSPGSLT